MLIGGMGFGHYLSLLSAADIRDSCYPAIEAGGGIRDGAWVAEVTDLVDMSSWPSGGFPPQRGTPRIAVGIA